MNTKEYKKNYDMLNPEQREAVDTLDGPVMVIAGPGTGKTQIIGMRTASIILKAGVDPSNILITTFTEAGVIAIRERLISMMGSDAYKVEVSTIHSFSQDVIKNFPEKFTTQKLDTPIDDIESMELVSEIVSEKLKNGELEYLTSYGDTLFYVRHIKRSIDSLKLEGVTPEKLSASTKEETEKSLIWLEEKRNNKRIKKIEKYETEHEVKIGKLHELRDIFQVYNEALRERHLYDFNDMINFVLERFRSDEDLRAFYAETYQYIMLDEYQDTNNPQNEIVDMILSYGENNNIMVVGDDDQSIYRFQGANIENMLDFTTKYQNTKIIVLDKNYRSSQSILDISKNLIEHNSERLISRIPGLDKQLFSQLAVSSLPLGENGEGVSLYMALTEIDERVYIKDTILDLQKNKVENSEIAIIVRSNREVQEYSEFLGECGIDVSSKIDANILESDYIKLIISFLKVLENPYIHETAFINLLRSSLIDIDAMDILKINTYLYRENYVRRGNKLKIFDVLRDTTALETIGVTHTSKIEKFIHRFMDVSRQFSEHNFVFAFSYLLREFDVFELLKNTEDFYALQDIYTFFHVLKGWSRYKQDLSLKMVLDKLDLYRRYGYRINRQTDGTKESGVQVITAHSSKGLEYEHVFIPGLYTGNWDEKKTRQLIKLPEGIAGDGLQFAENPDLSDAERKKYEKQRQNEEDRRLFFVALTRAKQGLYLCFPASISGKAKIISPFIRELGDIETIESKNSLESLNSEREREILSESRLVSYSQDELEYIKTFFRNYKLSASDLNTFLVNPKDFLDRTVYRYPFEENENSVFGTMYHRTLELFYKKILDLGEIQDYEYMEYVYLRQLEREYLSHEERTRLKRRGIESLKGYYETYKSDFKAPLKTEYKFSRRNVFFDGIAITGIIDKIELLSEEYSENTGGGSLFSQDIMITDYKTGLAKYIGEVKGIDAAGNKDDNFERGRYGRQLMFYKLLFENDHELSSQYNLAKLELDFCEGKKGNYKKLEVEFSDEEYEEFKNLVKETYQKMTDINFWKEYLKV